MARESHSAKERQTTPHMQDKVWKKVVSCYRYNSVGKSPETVNRHREDMVGGDGPWMWKPLHAGK